jgi:hypothetical protein
MIVVVCTGPSCRLKHDNTIINSTWNAIHGESVLFLVWDQMCERPAAEDEEFAKT